MLKKTVTLGTVFSTTPYDVEAKDEGLSVCCQGTDSIRPGLSI